MTSKQLFIRSYIEKIKSIQMNILDYIDDDENKEENYQNFISLINESNTLKNKYKIEQILLLILKIANNHHRSSNFFSKIEQILLFFKDSIKQNFSNIELFEIFKKQKRLLLFFFKEKMIEMDQVIYHKMTTNQLNSQYNYTIYFFNEMEPFINKDKAKSLEDKIPQNSEELRKSGNNDSNVCQFIQKDSLADFISHVNNSQMKLSSKVKHSEYETNSFLIKNNPSIIEYAAFYGSIEIFKYLSEKVELKPSIYLYAIHGRNMEIVHLLEQNKVEPQDKSYKEIIKEAIKCHHNEMTQYYIDHFIKEKDQMKESIVEFGFHYHNYSFLPDEKFNDNKAAFISACKYGYSELVEMFLKKKVVNSNISIISYIPHFNRVSNLSFTHIIFFLNF
ncbi:hypothetical protein M9Y10_030140 [Tritrichomonas musculus]|uniref:DUF3447 domain-containing protein n=1 Tax=Tritrichomonas musculus TaxID=1915356 RepID=A0ABR2KP57_9EUKA